MSKISRKKYTTQNLLELRGRVVRGEAIGRTLGYPTANLTHYYFRYHPVPYGVYAGWATAHKRKHPAMGIVGVDGKIEVHLIGWRGNLYGTRLCMELTERLRPIRAFHSTAALQRQIIRDIVRARRVLGYSSRRRPK